MRKLIAILSLCLLLTGCGIKYEEAEDVSMPICGGYFTLIKKWSDGDGIYRIAYANDTKVKYLICSIGYGKGITPLYNADGSLQVYEESEVQNADNN